jgi:hypothetical protein
MSLPCETVRARMQRAGGRLSLAEVLCVGSQWAAALDGLHQRPHPVLPQARMRSGWGKRGQVEEELSCSTRQKGFCRADARWQNSVS